MTVMYISIEVDHIDAIKGNDTVNHIRLIKSYLIKTLFVFTLLFIICYKTTLYIYPVTKQQLNAIYLFGNNCFK